MEVASVIATGAVLVTGRFDGAVIDRAELLEAAGAPVRLGLAILTWREAEAVFGAALLLDDEVDLPIDGARTAEDVGVVLACIGDLV